MKKSTISIIKTILIVMMLIGEGGTTIAPAQCDCPGTVPFGLTVVSGGVNNGRIMGNKGSYGFNMEVGTSHGDKLFRGTDEADNTYDRKFTGTFVDASAKYAVVESFDLLADIAYNRFKIEDMYSKKNYSVTYLTLLADYNLIPEYRDDEFILSAGVRVPFGNDLPDSTGTSVSYSRKFGFTGSAIWNKMLNSRLNLITIAGGNIFPTFGSDNATGNDAFFRLMLRANGFYNFIAGAGVFGNYHWRDKINNNDINNSGGFLLNAEFTIGYSFRSPVNAFVGLNASPMLLCNVEGFQIPQQNKISLTLSYQVK